MLSEISKNNFKLPYFIFTLNLLILQGNEVQISHLRLSLPGLYQAADISVYSSSWSVVYNIGRKRGAIPEFFRGCPQCSPLQYE